MSELETPFGKLALERLPRRRNEQMLPYDAADRYLLDQLHEHYDNRGESIPDHPLIVNDSFGALSCALNEYQPELWCDLFTAHWSARHNAQQNFGEQAMLTTTPASQPPQQERYSLVVIKIPKTLSLLDAQLAEIAPRLAPDAQIFAAGMVKHTARSSIESLARLGDVTPSLARQKARCFHIKQPLNAPLAAPPLTAVEVPTLGIELHNGANLFSRTQLDIGSRFFLEHFSKLPSAARVADIGCGNGLLGIAYQRRHTQSSIYFCDDSYLAVKSAHHNAQRLCPSGEHLSFQADDSLTHYSGEPFELILCNPPFHQKHEVGDQTAWRMFKQSHQQLAVGGELWIVGNRHLSYHQKLKRLFGNCTTVAGNRKFVVLKSRKTA